MHLLAPHFPAIKRATAVEWWAHCRGHSSGHQLHFDSDDEGAGGVRNPLVSTVLYLTGGPEGAKDGEGMDKCIRKEVGRKREQARRGNAGKQLD